MTDQDVARAVTAIAQGGMVVAVDDEDRENEGDLIMAGAGVNAASVAYFLEHTSGFLCVAMPEEWASELGLRLMVEDNTEALRTAFCVSVDARRGTTTGISAADRAATVRALADPLTRPDDLAKPGHVLPLLARQGGLLKRAGHTEATVDLCRMAGVSPVGLLCEITTADRMSMMRGTQLKAWAASQGLPFVTIADLVRHRRRRERLVVRTGEAPLATKHGEFRAYAYRSALDGAEHLALTVGDVGDGRDVLVRVHSECLTGDLVGSLRCDCGEQFQASLAAVQAARRGVIVYLRGQEGRGIGLGHKLQAYGLQDTGLDTVDANIQLGLPVDSREYGVGAQILADLRVRKVRLMTNNPAKYGGLQGYGISVTGRVPIATHATPENLRYLRTKRDRMGHDLHPTASASEGELS